MHLNNEDPETDRLARELANAAGESITVATRKAIEERLERLTRRPNPTVDLRDIIARGRARPVLDRRDESDILGYDASGLPS